MGVTVRRKIIGWIGMIGIIVQFIRYVFDLLLDNNIELFAFCAFILMAVNLKALQKIIINKLTRQKNESQN